MNPRPLFLVCNSHLDPVWLWEWEEGLSEALSTFRVAARFCAEHEGFVFCHNEALLYEWVETYDPDLFTAIRELVARGRWHVMGGWYVQPDVNIPSGEALVRQALVGLRYFESRFGTVPTVAVNVDSFGHSRGLVQILAKAGYRGYLFCRPDVSRLDLPASDFVWVGVDGSEIIGHRAPDHYNSQHGQAGPRVARWVEGAGARQDGLLLWGIGNHGGGPSRTDLDRIAAVQAEAPDGWEIRHGRPEDYFARIEDRRETLPRFDRPLQPFAVGCYTSSARLKQAHRRLEALYGSVERLSAHAAIVRAWPYPHDLLRSALRDLLFCEFHDILAGTSIGDVEAAALRRLAHGHETLQRLRMRLFARLAEGEPPAAEGEFPIFVLNTHPYDVETDVSCEFQPLEPNMDAHTWWEPSLCDTAGAPIACQLEKERCNILTDQRKRVTFRARLSASTLHRFSCRLDTVPIERRPPPPLTPPGDIAVIGDRLEVVINHTTGCLDRYRVDGVDYVAPGAFRPLLMRDNADPWGMKVRAFRDLADTCRLLAPDEAARAAGIEAPVLPPVRIIEDGPLHTTVEALLGGGRSVVTLRYRIPRTGIQLGVECRVAWFERDRMLKLEIPSGLDGPCVGQIAYGVESYPASGEEQVAHAWVALLSPDRTRALTIINDAVYGFDRTTEAVRLSLLRAPGYAAHPVDGQPHILRQDRYEARLDQGEHVFRFSLQGGPAGDRLAAVTREAQIHNDPPFVLCWSPRGAVGLRPPSGLRVADDVVQVGAVKAAEDDDRLIVRLFEPTGQPRSTTLEIPHLGWSAPVSLSAWEIKTVAIDTATGTIAAVNLLEREPGLTSVRFQHRGSRASRATDVRR